MTANPPPITSAIPLAPAALDHVVRTCLAKDPEERFHSAHDLLVELRWILESSAQTAGPPIIGAGRRRLLSVPWMAVVVLAAALAAALYVHVREPQPVDRTMRFLLPLPEKMSFRTGVDTAALSPDGTRVVFSAQDSNGVPALYLRSLDSLDTKVIPGTSSSRASYYPFWSPDGRFIGFHADLQLKKVDLTGGNPVTLCSVYGFTGGTWNRDDVILFSSIFNTIRRVSANGGTPAPALKPITGQNGQAWPFFLPDGKHFLFSVLPNGGIHVGTLDSLDSKQITRESSNGQYSSAGFLVFGRNGTVMAQPFDVSRLQTTGDSTQVADSVAATVGVQGAVTVFSVVGKELVYLFGPGGALTQLTWFDRQRGRTEVLGDAADYSNPALSPDGRMLAVGKRDPISRWRDIFVFDLNRGTLPTRLTFDPADDFNPQWMPDGKNILFSSNRKGQRDLYRKSSTGAGADELLLQSSEDKSVEDITRDGRYVIFNQTGGPYREVWAKPLSGDGQPFRVLSASGNVAEGHVSPNGKWIAYSSFEAGTSEIYVQDFPPRGGRWQVSVGGGSQSSWNANGKELFYLQGERLMAVDVETESDRFEIKSTPRVLFEAPFANPLRNAYVVSPDGQRFLVNSRIETKDTLPMRFVLNWPAALKH